MEARGIEPLTS